MKYTRFKFKNYRGIKDVEINIGQPSKKPICLLGLNESGKTTILKAIETIGKLIHGKELENEERLSIRPKGVDFIGDIIFETELQLNEDDNSALEIPKKSKLKTLTITFTYQFKNHEYKNNSIEIKDIKESDKDKVLEKLYKMSPAIIYYNDFMFNVPDEISFEDEDNDSPNKFWQKAFNDIYQYSFNKQHSTFRKDIIDWIKTNNNDKNTVDTRLKRMGNRLNESITKKWADIAKKQSTFKEIKLTATKETYTKYTISVASQENIYKVHERSKGFRWFFSFLIATEFRKHRDKNTIFLLDEPASNLHCSAQEKIKKALDELSKDTTVIYSTHSPYLLDSKDIKTTHLVKNESDNNEYADNNISCVSIEQDMEDSKAIQKKQKLDKLRYIRPLLDHISYKEPMLLFELMKTPEIKELIININNNDKKTVKNILEKITEILQKTTKKILPNISAKIIEYLIMRLLK